MGFNMRRGDDYEYQAEPDAMLIRMAVASHVSARDHASTARLFKV